MAERQHREMVAAALQKQQTQRPSRYAHATKFRAHRRAEAVNPLFQTHQVLPTMGSSTDSPPLSPAKLEPFPDKHDHGIEQISATKLAAENISAAELVVLTT
eukprot:TRINITY_DN46028_c0_g1_i1.p3 TRINITY_DN46028_c0_g1~~TRINITY_DN46028_c0_g1_i1.p3  ORF type:complete len:102 (+),score=23.79 TRINITY_DN46028_c0_g1_i1:344-649(+)